MMVELPIMLAPNGCASPDRWCRNSTSRIGRSFGRAIAAAVVVVVAFPIHRAEAQRAVGHLVFGVDLQRVAFWPSHSSLR